MVDQPFPHCLYGRKDTHKRTREASVAVVIVLVMLVVSLGSVGDLIFSPGGGELVGTILKQLTNGKALVQARLASLHVHT